MTWGMMIAFLIWYLWAVFTHRWAIATFLVGAWILYLFAEAARYSFQRKYFYMTWNIGLAWWMSTDLRVLWARHNKQKETRSG